MDQSVAHLESALQVRDFFVFQVLHSDIFPIIEDVCILFFIFDSIYLIINSINTRITSVT
jgi:hypothetical protein